MLNRIGCVNVKYSGNKNLTLVNKTKMVLMMEWRSRRNRFDGCNPEGSNSVILLECEAYSSSYHVLIIKYN